MFIFKDYSSLIVNIVSSSWDLGILDHLARNKHFRVLTVLQSKMSTGGMYHVKPVFAFAEEFKHTSSMYNLGAVNMKSSITHTTINTIPSSTDRSGKENEILSRQEKLLNDLSAMQDQLIIIRDKINAQKSSKKVVECTDISTKFKTFGVRDIVINADPNYPPYALLWITKLWNLPVDISVHLHSSISSLPKKLSIFEALSNVAPNEYSIKITFVWKEVGPDAQLVISPIKNKTILGEVNILRFFQAFLSENENLETKIKNNEILDIAHRLNHVSGKEIYVLITKFSNLLGNNDSFAGNMNPAFADVAMWSVLCRKTKSTALPSNLKKLVSAYSNILGIQCFEER